MGQMYGPEQQHRLMSHVMEQSGIKNSADYLMNPAQIPPQEPDPAQQMQMEMQQKQMELQERQTSVSEMKAQMDAQIAQMKLQLEQMKAQQSFALQSDSMDLKESQLEHKKYVDTEELKIARTADDVRAIASPTG